MPLLAFGWVTTVTYFGRLRQTLCMFSVQCVSVQVKVVCNVFDDVLQNAKHRTFDASNDVNRPPLVTALEETCEG